MVEDRCIWLVLGEQTIVQFPEQSRYVCARDITFDLLVTLYDVNTRTMAIFRLVKELPEATRAKLVKFISSLKRPTLELRAIGMQNSYKEMLPLIAQMRELSKAILVEVDLFGTSTRHVVIDMQTGMPYNLLLLNRVYRPGELTATMKKEEFDKLRPG